MKAVLDDLTTLSPRRLERRLEKLAGGALHCRAVTVFDGNAEDGLTVALHVDSRRRRDVLDLARVIQDDPRVHGSSDWSLLPPTRRRGCWRLLLRVRFERPVRCTFTVAFDIRGYPSEPLHLALPLLLAASRLVFAFDGRLEAERPLVWVTAPVVREPVLELLATVGT